MSGESAVERVEAALAAAHASQDSYNAFISLDDERALARARDLDERRSRGDDVGPLYGVPIGLKDIIDHEGRVNTCGSAFYKDVPARSAPAVERLEDAGGVVIGRTNLHEWAFGFNSENPHWGPVRNPWDTSTSAGGSSGGSGASIAAGITPIAIGTDTGGSVRVPAALCGTYGLKVTYGRIPLDGVFPLVPSVDTVGPLADSMDGIEAAYRAMSGDDGEIPDPRSLRFGVPEPWYSGAPLQDGVSEAFERAIEDLRSSGHEVHTIQMPDVVPTSRILGAIAEVAAVHREFREQGKPYGRAVEERIEAAEQVSAEEAEDGRAWQQMLRTRFHDAFGTVDFLITPGCAAFAKTIGRDDIGGENHRNVLSYFSAIVNHALHPALALPILETGAPPASLQVIGPLNSELELIGLGRETDRSGLTGFRLPGANSPTPGGG